MTRRNRSLVEVMRAAIREMKAGGDPVLPIREVASKALNGKPEWLQSRLQQLQQLFLTEEVDGFSQLVADMAYFTTGYYGAYKRQKSEIIRGYLPLLSDKERKDLGARMALLMKHPQRVSAVLSLDEELAVEVLNKAIDAAMTFSLRRACSLAEAMPSASVRTAAQSRIIAAASYNKVYRRRKHVGHHA